MTTIYVGCSIPRQVFNFLNGDCFVSLRNFVVGSMMRFGTWKRLELALSFLER